MEGDLKKHKVIDQDKLENPKHPVLKKEWLTFLSQCLRMSWKKNSILILHSCHSKNSGIVIFLNLTRNIWLRSG